MRQPVGADGEWLVLAAADRTRWPRITVDEGAGQRAVDQDRELAGSRGDRLRFPDAEGETSIKGAEGGLRLADRFGGQTERGGGAIGGRLRAGPEQAAARDFVIRGEGQPRGEVLLGGPSCHVRPDLGDEFETGVRAEAIDLGEVDAPGEMMEEGADVQAGFIPGPLLLGTSGR